MTSTFASSLLSSRLMIQYFVSGVLIGLSVAQAAVYRLPVSVDWKDQIRTRAILYGEGSRRELSMTVIPSGGTALIAGPWTASSNLAIHLDIEHGVGPGLLYIADRLTFSNMYSESILSIEEFLSNYQSISLIHNYSNHTDTSLLIGIELADFGQLYCLPGSSLLLPRSHGPIEFSLTEPDSGIMRRLESHLRYYADSRRPDAICSIPYEWYDSILGDITSRGAQIVDRNSGVFSNCYPSVLNQLSPIGIRFLDNVGSQSSIVILPEDYLVFDTSRDGICALKVIPHIPDESGVELFFLNTFALRGVNTFIATGVRQMCDSTVV